MFLDFTFGANDDDGDRRVRDTESRDGTHTRGYETHKLQVQIKGKRRRTAKSFTPGL